MKSIQALLALFACAFLPLHAASLDDLKWTTTGGKVTITGCNTTATGELVIPDTIKGNPVTSIGGAAFESCTSLTSITIPDSVTSIGDEAFFRCTSLTSITIPDGVTSIGDFAFENCTSLTSITIGNGVTSIGGSAFYGCTSLTSITIGNGVISIGGSAFRNCTSLTSITFLGTAPTVGTNAFTGVADGAIALVTIEALNSFGENDEKWNGLTLRSTEAPPQSLEVQLAQMTAERDAAILERDARPNQESYDALIAALSLRPTQSEYDTVVAERDARPTIGEVKDARLGSVVLQPDGANNNITIRFSIEETDDFRIWTKRDQINEVTVPLEASKRFYRFALEDK
ncbi:MAG: leucine-rich repeat domain-containing protein [Akkermansiaceae bacterium]